MKETAVTFRAAKGQRKLSMLTAYDYTTARLMEQSGVHALLVGDSLGMVVLGHADTLSVRRAARNLRSMCGPSCGLPSRSWGISA